ncbi:hypothetical protein SRHO_G00295560 [Serrasalmus rhombeus]
MMQEKVIAHASLFSLSWGIVKHLDGHRFPPAPSFPNPTQPVLPKRNGSSEINVEESCSRRLFPRQLLEQQCPRFSRRVCVYVYSVSRAHSRGRFYHAKGPDHRRLL